MTEQYYPRPLTPRGTKAIILATIVCAVWVAADLGSKAWAIENLSVARVTPLEQVCAPDRVGYAQARIARADMDVHLIEGTLRFHYAENCGAAFGIMNRWPIFWKNAVFLGVALLAMGALAYMFRTGRGGRWLAYSVPLVISGAIGNVVDRIRYGYVVDFIDFYGETPEWLADHIHGPYWHYPTFNVADVAITLGVVFLIIDSFVEGKLDRQAQEAQAKLEAGEGAAPEDAEPEAG